MPISIQKHIFLDKKNPKTAHIALLLKQFRPAPSLFSENKLWIPAHLLSYYHNVMRHVGMISFKKNLLTVGNCCKLYLLKNAWRSTGWGKAADWSCCLECNSIIHHWVMCYWCFCPAVSQIQETDSTCSSESLQHRAATCCCLSRKHSSPHFCYLIIYCVMAVNTLV